MASALIGGLVARGVPAGAIRVADPFRRRRRARRAISAYTAAAPDAAFAASDVLVLAVKPQQFRDATAPLHDLLQAGGKDPLIISVAAGIRLQDMQRWLGGRTRPYARCPTRPRCRAWA